MPPTPSPNNTKRFFLQTYGCQMNVHDSERMHGMLEFAGYEKTDDALKADVVIINTCAVREKPERKLFAELGRLRRLKKENPKMIIGVAGCMTPRDGDLIRERASHVDLLLGPRSIHRLPELVRKIELQRQPIEAVELFDDPTPITPIRRAGTISAWVDVMFGCSFACTFCAVPSARGKEISRPINHILDEIRELKYLGYKEITLLGQTVNAYGRDWFYRLPNATGEELRKRIDFAYLLDQINAIAPDMRIRFTSPHPQLFNDRLIRAIRDLPSVCEHVHLPLQSADDQVLRRMKRSYTYAKYRKIVDNLRKEIPDITITTDIIVGFPGETEEQFQRTVHALEENQIDQAFMFIYSPRRFTEALKYETEAVPVETQKRRIQKLIDVANDLFARKNKSEVGRTFEVLVEGTSEKNAHKLSGRTRGNKTVVFEGKRELIGKLVNVRTTRGFLWGFEGNIE